LELCATFNIRPLSPNDRSFLSRPRRLSLSSSLV
jgi:hypothetical protein